MSETRKKRRDSGTTADRIAFQHPAVFPEKLALDHILRQFLEQSRRPRLDSMRRILREHVRSSGTTGKMALINNRRFIGIDISAHYINIARQRLTNCGLHVLSTQPADVLLFSFTIEDEVDDHSSPG